MRTRYSGTSGDRLAVLPVQYRYPIRRTRYEHAGRWLTVPPLLPRVPVRRLFLTDARRRSPGDRNGKRAGGTRGHFCSQVPMIELGNLAAFDRLFAAFVEERSE